MGGGGLPFRCCERVGTNWLQFAHSFNKYLPRNRYVANTRVSDRNTMVNKPWSLTSDSLGSSEERVPKENRKGKAIIIQKDKQDQGFYLAYMAPELVKDMEGQPKQPRRASRYLCEP